jgi:hypothetical protein
VGHKPIVATGVCQSSTTRPTSADRVNPGGPGALPLRSTVTPRRSSGSCCSLRSLWPLCSSGSGFSCSALRVENGSRLRVVHVSQLAAFPVRFVLPRAVSQRFWPWQQSRLATCPGVVRCDANVKGSHPRLTQERGEKHAHADFVQRCNSCAPILDSRYLSRQIPKQEWREIERLSLRTTPDTDAVGNLDVVTC